VRIPAAACGVAAVKTTRGRVPLDGVFPLSPGLDTVGPMARDVAGLVTGMGLLEPAFAVGPTPAGTPVVVRLRLGAEISVDPDVDEGVDAALDAAGWQVRELLVPDWRELARESGHVLSGGAGRAHAFLLERSELLSDRARQYIEEAVRERPERVVQARERLAVLGTTLARALQDADAVVLPTLADPPPLLEERDELRLTWLTVPFNVLGWPAVSLPACAPGERGAVPPSVQLVGQPWSEERLLALAGLLERR
jgi:amidase